MVIQVMFNDGTVLEQAVSVAEIEEIVEIGLAFKDEPGFNNVTIIGTQEAGAVPKMRHYIHR